MPHEPLLVDGLTALSAEDDRPAEAPGWLRPSAVRIDGDMVVSTWGQTPPHTTLSMATLYDFSRLCDGSAADIRHYAEKYGLLGVCDRHGLPHSFAPWSNWMGDEAPCRSKAEGKFSEPLSAYRTYARQALTMMQIADSIRKRVRSRMDQQAEPSSPVPASERRTDVQYLPARKPGLDQLAVPREMWEPLRPLANIGLRNDLVLDEDEPRPLDVVVEQMYLEWAIQAWLSIAQVNVRWTWPPLRPDPALEVGAGHLFGGLAVALALQTTRMKRLYLCQDCGKPFTPKQRKQVVRWCEACRDRASKREQEQRRRARRKAEALL